MKQAAGSPKISSIYKTSKRSCMKKRRVKARPSPEDAVHFIEGMRLMMGDKDEPTAAISLRVPHNILQAIKIKAKMEGKK